MVVYRFERGAKSKVILSHAHFVLYPAGLTETSVIILFKLLVNF